MPKAAGQLNASQTIALRLLLVNRMFNPPLTMGHKTKYKMKRMFILTALLVAVIGSAMGQTEIRTAEELAAIGTDKETLSGSYILTNDLTLDDWVPIGRMDHDGEMGFSGTFDGNGHTITINSFSTETDNTACVGLFGLIGEKGMVKNLRMTGKLTYTNRFDFLYIGAFAGVNMGHITCCVSSVDLTCEYAKSGAKTKTKCLFVYEKGQFGGCVAGINYGNISHCYSDGAIRVAQGRAAGITAGNGKGVKGGLGISVGSGGMSMSATPGKIPLTKKSIAFCYSTASVFGSANNKGDGLKIFVVGAANGLVSLMRSESAELYHCMALNRELEARGDSKPFALASPFPAAVMGLTGVEHPSFQFYYFDGIPVRRYVNDKLLKPKKLSPKHAVPLSTTQEESWWRLPDGLDEKEQRYVPGFPFGTDDMAPWQWDEQRKRPVLYWETTEKKNE